MQKNTPHFSFISALAALFTIIMLTSCSTPKALEYRDFKNLTIEKIGFATSTLKMDITYYNPNNMGLQLKRADLDIYMENNFVGHATQLYQINIPKLQEFTIPVQVDVDMKNVYKNIITSLMNKQVLVKVSGSIQAGKANIFMTLPVNYQGYQSYKIFD
ncbi:LEA type 2 family protein [Ferruginibacter albus]|uniref:LEA type 2 family protein n=1 Tax=Ferruginibacter albus TaxID=2875540 RepID=UPI001CC67AA1|nr:LEA type 2 family protein [Ferruginibacter albus]UAY51000.1 LEA type 2 family protein [Ferruginibacter albus]